MRLPSVLERHGFSVGPIDGNDPAVVCMAKAYYMQTGMETDTSGGATYWLAITRPEGVYAVVGGRSIRQGLIEVTDFYAYPSRLGVLAAHGAVQVLKDIADSSSSSLVWSASPHNTPLWRAVNKTAAGRMTIVSVVARYDPEVK